MPTLTNHLKGQNTQSMYLKTAYGEHIVEGFLCQSLKSDGSPFDIHVKHKLGRREWEGPSALWWRGFAIPAADYFFHPGRLSSGPSDTLQGIDTVFNTDSTNNLTPWIRAKLPQSEIQSIDPTKEAPEGLYGRFKCLKVNDYDSNGNITAFNYSPNPARVLADAILVEGRRNPNRIDWGAWRDFRDFCNLQKLVDYSQIPRFGGFGLTSQYYSDQTLTTLHEKRIDAVVEFIASAGAPAYGLQADNFSARHQGKIKFQYTETYTLYLTANDGGRLWINNVLLIDFWTTPGTHTVTFNATAEQFENIKVEWHDSTGDAEVRLEWSSASQVRQVIPAARLYPEPEMRNNYEAHILFKQPTRLDDAVRQILKLANGTYQRVNGKYRFISYEQLTAPTYHFKHDVNYHPKNITIDPLDISRARNVWTATCRDLDSQYLQPIQTPLLIELDTLIAKNNGQRNDGDLIDMHNCSRWQAYKLLEHQVTRTITTETVSIDQALWDTYPVLKSDRVSVDIDFDNTVAEDYRVVTATDHSSESTANTRDFVLKTWNPSSELVPELIPDTTPPTVPTGLAATVISSSQINLSYNAATDDRGVVGYEIEQNGTVFNVGNILNPMRTGLLHSTAYTFKVRAYDSAGNRSPFSAPVTDTTQASSDTTPPTVPGNYTATVISTSQINLAWDAATDNVGVAGYELSQDGSTPIDLGNVLTVQRTGFAANSTHTFKVRAYDAAGNRGDWTALLTRTTEQNSSGLSAPFLYLFTDNVSVYISWNAISGATSYELYYTGSVSDIGNVLADTIYPDPGLHRFKVRAKNAAGVSVWSNERLALIE